MKLYEHPRGVRVELRWCLASCHGGLSYSLFREQRDSCRTPGTCSSGACEPCPETAGSDCSRCANDGRADFLAPCDEKTECPGYSRLGVYDVVKVPKLKPGKYVVGFRYDCDATAQVWSNCADIDVV